MTMPIKKELKRKTVEPFLHYRKPIIVEIVPGDVIRLRLLKQRLGSAVSIRIADLYYELLRRRAAALKAERKKERKGQRK
jgi:hypothetical protein